MAKSIPTANEIEAWLIQELSSLQNIDPSKIDVKKTFHYYGLVSKDAVLLSGKLQNWLGLSLSPTLLWDFPTIEKLSCHLAGEQVNQWESKKKGQSLYEHEPMAIVGMGCRFPGAENLEKFWDMLVHGIDGIREVPADRWNIEEYYDPDPSKPGKMTTRWGGFLEKMDEFDADFFGISPKETIKMDPQQRLLLEVTWEALEDAGILPNTLAGSQTGVFVGISTHDYARVQLRNPGEINAYSGTGTALSIAANRISYLFDLRGPSLAIDTACSSSLVAVHEACQSIRNGECQLAIVGGVNLVLLPDIGINFSKAGAMASDGRCKTFDARADGYVRGEGAGVVILKPLSQALRDQDRIYAIIRGSSVNQDGRSNGLMAPNGQAQEAMLRETYRRAGISPAQVQYVEAHGTGTALGDPIEVKALGNVLREGRPSDQPCKIGSVKTNIGHLEAAAGIAGLIKVALAIKHRVLPPNLHFQKPNPHIPFDQLPLVVQDQLGPWPQEAKPLVAGVSSFGFGGTITHVVVEEASARESQRSLQTDNEDKAQILTLSAHTGQALKEMAKKYVNRLSDAQWDVHAHDLCYTANVRRSHHHVRLAVVYCSKEHLKEQLTAFLQGENRIGLASGVVRPEAKPSKIAFVFPGQGPQWMGMGRELFRLEPVFREMMERCDELIQEQAGWSLLDELEKDEDESQLDQTEITQPALFAIQVSLAKLWKAWGVQPNVVIGHSMGEVAAAYVSGALSLEDAIRVIVHRGRVMKKAEGKGKMAAIDLSPAEMREVLKSKEDKLSIAAINSKDSVVIAGDPDALDAVIDELEQRDIFCRQLRVNLASHSPHMEPLKEELKTSLSSLQPQFSLIPMLSTVTGRFCDGFDLDGDYWAQNLREPVLFAEALDHLLVEESYHFIEVSPHPILTKVIQHRIDQSDSKNLAFPSLRRHEPERETMLTTLGALYTAGWPVDWSNIYPQGECVSLPTYCFERKRFPIERESQRKSRYPSHGRTGYSLLGDPIRLATQPDTLCWETEIHLEDFSYLVDHRVQGSVVVPGSLYIEAAVSAAKEVWGEEIITVSDLHFEEPLFLSEEEARKLQMEWRMKLTGEEAEFRVYSQSLNAPGDWIQHVSGRAKKSVDFSFYQTQSVEEIKVRCPHEISADDFYDQISTLGLQYGPAFRGVKQFWNGHQEGLAKVRLSEEMSPRSNPYTIHPALLDASFHVMVAGLMGDGENLNTGTGAYLPVGVKRITVYDKPELQLWSYGRLAQSSSNQGELSGNLSLMNSEGKVMVEIEGLRLANVEQVAELEPVKNPEEWLYELKWEVQPLQGEQNAEKKLESSFWVIFADSKGVGQQLMSLLQKQNALGTLVWSGNIFRQTENGYEICPGQPDDYDRLLAELISLHKKSFHIVHLWSLDHEFSDRMSSEELMDAQERGSMSVFQLIQAFHRAQLQPAQYWFVTRNTQAVGKEEQLVNLPSSLIWGMSNAIALEHPGVQCFRVDLGAPSERDTDMLMEEILSASEEDAIAFRKGKRFVARLKKTLPEKKAAKNLSSKIDQEVKDYQLDILERGSFEQLKLLPIARKKPGSGEVELEVSAVGLNFNDVMNVMDILPGDWRFTPKLGNECVGRVVDVGEGVDHLQVGDEVIAITRACMGSSVTVNAQLVWKKPEGMEAEEAATIPIAFLTAHYALNELGRMAPGERVLIHAAAGGVGLAAVQLAQKMGAEIFATAGSKEKREFLRSLGVQHVMDSRSLHFSEEIMEATNGEGVDIVLNSLSGEAIARSISVLGPYGRFLEIGKSDIYQNQTIELFPFRKNLSYFAIDLDRMTRERPERIGAMMEKLIQDFENGILQPLPRTVFSIWEAKDAFRYMAQRKNVGKIVIKIEPTERVKENIHAFPVPSLPVRSNATYLVTGGLTGLGLLTAQWLAQKGARHLVLLGRRAPSIETEGMLEQLRQSGTQITVAQVDVTKKEDLADLLKKIRHSLPPLKGVIHAAGILDDGILIQMDRERFTRVLKPKVVGAWNLHQLSLGDSLDFFVMYSSATSILGSPGQGNYSAANAFLDVLAYYRKAKGLAALSINWGPWSEIGLAAQPDRGERLKAKGMGSISPEIGMQLLEQILGTSQVQVAVLPANWSFLIQSYPTSQKPSLLKGVVDEQDVITQKGKNDVKSQPILHELAEVPPEKRSEFIAAHLKTMVGKVVGMDATQIEPNRKLNTMGIDSLMAIELRNSIQLGFKVNLPIVLFLKGTNISEIAEEILQRLSLEEPEQQVEGQEEIEELLSNIDELSDEEVERLYEELMDSKQ